MPRMRILTAPEQEIAEAREELLRLIAAPSLMAWAHINMLGEYDFSDEKLRDSVGILPLESAA